MVTTYILSICISSPVATVIRGIIGIILLLLFPGYLLLNILFRNKIDNIDIIEKFALSIGLSMATVSILCFILNYTPFGIRFKSIIILLISIYLSPFIYLKNTLINKNFSYLKFYINNIDRLFFIIVCLTLLSLIISKYWSQFIIGYFICLLSMIVILFYNIVYKLEEKDIITVIIIELLILFLICVSFPLLIGWIPWRLSLHHAVYAQYIVEHGIKFCPNYLLIPVGFQSWPGSHMLLASLIIISGIDRAISYHMLCILFGLTAVIFFYLFIRNLTQNNKLAILSALFWSLFCNYIQFWPHAMHQGFSRAMVMMTLYALTKLSTLNDDSDREKVGYKLISIISILAAIISHHLEPVIFIVLFGALLIYNKINKKFAVNKSFLLFNSILILSYWTYIVASAYLEGWVNYFWENIKLLFQGVTPTTTTVEKYYYHEVFFPAWFVLLKRIYWILYALLGFAGVSYIIICKFKFIKHNANDENLNLIKKIEFTILWTIIILTIAGIIYITGGSRFPVWRVLEYLIFPLSISIQLIILKILNIKSKIKFCLFSLIIITLFLGCITAYPPSVYTSRLTPLAETTFDKYAAIYIGKYTDKDVIVFGDVRSMEAVLYWGFRGGYWGEKIDEVFKSNTSEVEKVKDIINANYILLNIFNIKYKFYYRWGEFKLIPNNSIILYIDTYSDFGKIYDNGMCRIYLIYR